MGLANPGQYWIQEVGMALMNDDELKDLKAVAADPATTADDFDEAIRRLTVLTS